MEIDRSRPFDPKKFIGGDWKIVEEDERSLALVEIDPLRIDLVSTHERGEEWVTGEKNLIRLKKTKSVRLDAKIFQTLWENQALIPSSWKEKLVFFDGTLLEDPSGDRGALCLGQSGARWNWGCGWQGGYRRVVYASAVLVD